MKKIYILLVVLAAVLTSCGFLFNTTPAPIIPTDNPQNLVQMGNPAILLTTTADLKVSPNKISYSESFNTILYDEIENYAKRKALSNALIENKADLLVCLAYDLNVDSKTRQTTVTVTGYPATYENFRQATAADTMLLYCTPVIDEYTGIRTKTKTVMSSVAKKY